MTTSVTAISQDTTPGMTMPGPYLLFLGDTAVLSYAKTAAGLHEWRRALCIGQNRLAGCRVDFGLPDMSPGEAAAHGARTMVIGIVNAGGFIDPTWVPVILDALACGLNVAAGMHKRLADDPVIAEAAARHGRQLYDVRHSGHGFDTGTGRKRSGKRVLTVGTDCVVGKKYTALALEKALRARSVKADFRATGQTGVMIAGGGIAIDAVVSDFVAGAAEWLSPDNDADHWDIIEGQGSLYHPAYAGVTLGLIHGSQPDALVICHEPVRKFLTSIPEYPVPPLGAFIEMNLAVARLTNPGVIAAGVSINTSRMSETETDEAVRAIEAETGLPCCDPIRHGADKIADNLLATLA